MVLKVHLIKIPLLPKQRLLFVAQAFQHFVVGLAVFVGDVQLVIFVVKILQLREGIHALGQGFVALLEQPLGLVIAFVFPGGLFLVRIASIDGVSVDGFNGNIRVIGAVKPAAPKPIEILPAGIFHGPEKIRRCRPLKGPAAGVLFEGIIELLSAEHTLTQNIERERGFGVGVIAGALQGICAGHDRHFVFLL